MPINQLNLKTLAMLIMLQIANLHADRYIVPGDIECFVESMRNRSHVNK